MKRDWWVWILILLYAVIWPFAWIAWRIARKKELEYEYEDWPWDEMEDLH